MFLRALAAAAVILVSGCMPAFAGVTGDCYPRAAVEEVWKDDGQAVVGTGVSPGPEGSGALMIVTTNPQTGEWVLAFSNDGKSLCIAAFGEGWTSIDPPPPGDDA